MSLLIFWNLPLLEGALGHLLPGAHGEGDPHAAPACGHQAPLFAEEWDLDALAAWFGDHD